MTQIKASKTLESPSSRIRPPAFSANNNANISKSVDAKSKVTKLAYVSKSRYSAPKKEESKPVVPEPKESTKNVVQIIQSAVSSSTANQEPAPPPIPAKKKTLNSVENLEKTKVLMKPPTPPQRTSSSSLEPKLEEKAVKKFDEKSSDLKPVKTLPQSPEPEPKVPCTSPKATEQPTTSTPKQTDEKKSKFGAKFGSKLSKISPKFPRKKIEVAKSFIVKKDENKDEKAAKPEPEGSPSKMSKIEILDAI